MQAVFIKNLTLFGGEAIIRPLGMHLKSDRYSFNRSWFNYFSMYWASLAAGDDAPIFLFFFDLAWLKRFNLVVAMRGRRCPHLHKGFIVRVAIAIFGFRIYK